MGLRGRKNNKVKFSKKTNLANGGNSQIRSPSFDWDLEIEKFKIEESKSNQEISSFDKQEKPIIESSESSPKEFKWDAELEKYKNDFIDLKKDSNISSQEFSNKQTISNTKTNKYFDDKSDRLSNNETIASEPNDSSVDEYIEALVEDYNGGVVVKAENLNMDFKVSKDKIDTLKEFTIRTIKHNKEDKKIVKALDDVSFEVYKGDRLGIIGFNGAGKSTLLKILAGVYEPTSGKIETNGKIAPLLELGAGFDENYSGRDNIFLNAAILGYDEEFIKGKYDEILEFSELGEAIKYPVKNYSSGMRAKLGFSIATIVEPDILIIDEILSVGDIKFRRKSSDKLRSLIGSGITVLLVSHSLEQIRSLCNKAIWIDEGKVAMYGEVNEVCDAYVKAANYATKDQLHNLEIK